MTVGEGVALGRPHPNTDVARQFWSAIAAADTDQINDTLAPDVNWRVCGTHQLAGEYRGLHGVLDYLARVGELADGDILEASPNYESGAGFDDIGFAWSAWIAAHFPDPPGDGIERWTADDFQSQGGDDVARHIRLERSMRPGAVSLLENGEVWLTGAGPTEERPVFLRAGVERLQRSEWEKIKAPLLLAVD